MSAIPIDRPAPSTAGPELLVLAQWEEFTGWLLAHTGRWPKSVRFTLAQRVEEHALDITEMLVESRYVPAARAAHLREVNLRLERMRHLLRLALATHATSNCGFESVMRGIDECGRMVHGWREALKPRSTER
ncbi:MAG: four helix bundle protein [Myxococcales bacterium]|nr:four helix bundle protein [Myxococcales bacterium]